MILSRKLHLMLTRSNKFLQLILWLLICDIKVCLESTPPRMGSIIPILPACTGAVVGFTRRAACVVAFYLARSSPTVAKTMASAKSQYYKLIYSYKYNQVSKPWPVIRRSNRLSYWVTRSKWQINKAWLPPMFYWPILTGLPQDPWSSTTPTSASAPCLPATCQLYRVGQKSVGKRLVLYLRRVLYLRAVALQI